MKRRDFLKTAAAVGGGVMLHGHTKGARTRPGHRPNVVIVNIDNLDESVLGPYGNTFVETHNLDALAKRSVIMNNHVSVGRCAPSRASLMTGRQSLRTGVVEVWHGHQVMQRDEKTIGNHFKRAGYATAMIGKWHIGNVYPYRPEDRGFDEVLTYFGSYSPRTPEHFRLRHNGRWKNFKGFRGKPWFDYAVKFIQNNAENPFCLYLATSMVHEWNIGPQDLYEKYRRKLQQAGQYNDVLDEKRRHLRRRYKGQNLDKQARKHVDNLLHLYAEIDFIDQGLGRIIRTLQARGLDENTIIIFCSDGSGAGAPAIHRSKSGKAKPKDHRYSHPFMISWPAAGWRSGSYVNRRTANFDVLPTLTDLCGVAPIETVQMDGQSFRPLLESDPDRWKKRFFIMDDTSAYSPEPEWPVMEIKPLFQTTLYHPDGGSATWRKGRQIGKTDLTVGQLDQVKARYLDFWSQAMYGYRRHKHMVAGTKHANPLFVHNQYCAPLPDPHSHGPHPVNYKWPIEFASDGTYKIEFWDNGTRAYPPENPPKEYSRADEAHLLMGKNEHRWKASTRDKVPNFTVKVKAGKYLLDAVVNPDTEPSDPNYVVITKT